MNYNLNSTEAELIEGCRFQNRLAQKYLYQKFFGKMLGISMRYTGNREEAIEVLNTAFCKVFTSIDQYKPTGSSIANWIAKIVFNSSIDFVRKHKTYRKTMDFESTRELSIDNEAIDNLNSEDLFKVIQKLPAATRAVFCLYVIDGYKHWEVAEKLGISVGTSKWHLSNAKKSLQKMLKHYIRPEVNL